MLKINKKDLKNLLTGLGVLVLFLLSDFFQIIPLEILKIDIAKMSVLAKLIYSVCFQLLLVFIIILIYKDYLKEKGKEALKHSKEYFDKYFRYWIVLLVLMLGSNYLIGIIMPDSMPTNEETIRSIFELYPVYMFISAVIIAPVLEELVFRLSFRYMFTTDLVFIFMSGLMFGAIHVLPSAENLMELLYIIPYSIPGFVFAYVLAKSRNIFVSMGLHFIHNGILLALQFLVTFMA